jgi:hypothetical protein
MNEKEQLLIKLLRSKPDFKKGFLPLLNWEEIIFDKLEQEAFEIAEQKRNVPDIEKIDEFNTNVQAISYFRYDLKKVLIRTRKLYIDDYLSSENKIIVPYVGCGFFEPLLICFSFTDSIGTYQFENHQIRNTLNELKEGYGKYSSEFELLYRNGITHQLRPHGPFFIDLNTETEYRSPYITSDNSLYINVVHFLDSLVIHLENFISSLKTEPSAITKFRNGLISIQKEHNSVKQSIQYTRSLT